MKLGWAAGRVLAGADSAQRGERPGVLIGKDTRISGYLLEAALEAGLSAAGVDVYLCGPLPTPGIAYLTRALRLSAGIVISASHNPFDDNGIKFFSGARRQAARRHRSGDRDADGRSARLRVVGATRQGATRRRRGRPLRRVLQEHVSRPISTCRDCGSSSTARTAPAYHVAPPVFHELGAEVIAVGAEPDGLNINAGVGATHPRFLADEVRQPRCGLRHRAGRRRRPAGDGRPRLVASTMATNCCM